MRWSDRRVNSQLQLSGKGTETDLKKKEQSFKNRKSEAQKTTQFLTLSVSHLRSRVRHYLLFGDQLIAKGIVKITYSEFRSTRQDCSSPHMTQDDLPTEIFLSLSLSCRESQR